MKFYDWKERSPEDWGYLIFTQKGIDKELRSKLQAKLRISQKVHPDT